MSDDQKVASIREPTELPEPLAYFVRELCFALEGMPQQFVRHGLTPAEAEALRPQINAATTALRRHLPQA